MVFFRKRSAEDGAGFIDSLRGFGHTIITLIRTRAELIVTELQEEKERRKEMFVLAMITAVFFGLGLLLVALFVVLLFWDTHRLLAAGAVTLLYFGIGLFTLIRLQHKIKSSPPPFAATISEFENDLKLLRGQRGE